MAKEQEKTLPRTLPIGQYAQDNYDEMARDIARTEGISPKAAMAKLVEKWKQDLERDVTSGAEHLIAWGEGRDPGWGSDEADLALAKELESAKRDPRHALAGHPEAVDKAEAVAQRRRDTRTAPVDLDAGTVPNSGGATVTAGAGSTEKASDKGAKK